MFLVGINLKSYNANSRRESNPAELPPDSRVVANHFLNAVVEAIHTESPGDGHTFEEDEEQQTETRYSVGVEDLEHVHTTLRKE